MMTLTAYADETANAGRKVVDQWQQTVVILEIVSKTTTTMFGETETEETQIEARGVVLDPSGLVVTALSSSDPMTLLNEMIAGMGEIEGMMGDMETKAEITGVKIILADGTALPAQIVLRDQDLDLAFFRPLKTPDKPLAALSYDKAAATQLLDTVFVLDRLGVSGNRAIAVIPDRIKAVVEKPRLLYVLLNTGTPGTPAFTENGGIIGILTLRRPPKGVKASMNMSMVMDDWMVVAIPLAEVQAIAEQAPAVEAK